jgi:iron complex outermembrane receptor protein
MRQGILLGMIVGVAASYAANSVRSQEASGGANVLGEVVVTARRVTEDIERTPVSVEAFSGAALQNSAVTDLSDITRIVPGVRFQGQGSIAYTEITMRGLGQTPVSTGSGPAVQVYFSEVPLTVVTNLPTFDLASVQVLRGPQGTLFGENTIGGAVLISPQLPTFDYNGYASASYGNLDYKAFEGAVNLPLIDDIAALRIAGQVRRRDGFIRNLGVGGDFGDINQNSFRASLLLTPVAGLSDTLVATYFYRNEHGPEAVPYAANPNQAYYPPLAGIIATALAFAPRTVNNTDPDVYLKNSDWSIVNTTKYDVIPNFSVKNIVGYQHTNQRIALNAGGLPVALFDPIRFTDFDTVTDEVQLLGDAFDRLQWLVGAFYGDSKPGGNNTVSVFGTNTSTYLASTNYATYASVNYKVTERLRLNLGFRYSWDRERACYLVTTGGIAYVPTAAECELSATTTGIPDGQGVASTSGSAPTWTGGLDYQASDDTFLYVTSRRGYRSGGLNAPLYNTPCTTGSSSCAGAIDLRPFQSVKDEFLTDVEVGVREEPTFLGRQQRLNLTAFRYVWNNVAGLLPVNCPTGGTGCPADPSIAYNAGQVTAWGVETDLLLNVAASFSFGINGAFTHQEQTRTGVPPAGFSGVIPPANLAAPKWAGTVYVDYLLPLHPADSDLRFRVEYFATTKYESQNYFVPGYGLANATLNWSKIAGSHFDFSIWLRNILDKNYIVAPVVVDPTQFPVKSADFGDPRTGGITLSYRF